MKFKRVRKFTGGVLGEMSEATNAVQKSLEKIRAVSPIRFIHENNSIAISARSEEKGGGSTEDYAFKVTAVINQNKTFTVNVLGGTAQTLGGTPYIYDDEELVNVEEGWHIYVVYENLEPSPSYTEYGEWRPGIKASSAADMANYTAPRDLVFEIGRISKEYIGNVRQDHKGNIVMPAISNVVDIQTKLP